MTDLKLIAVLTLPGVERSALYARRFLADTLVPDHLAPGAELLADMELAIDELVGNGIRHSASGDGGKVTIALFKGRDVIRPEVTDDGGRDSQPHLVPNPEGESGRGLRIVNALSLRWGYRATAENTTVWAEFPAME